MSGWKIWLMVRAGRGAIVCCIAHTFGRVVSDRAGQGKHHYEVRLLFCTETIAKYFMACAG